MKKWHVLFEDERNGAKVLEAAIDPAQISGRFHSAAATGRIDGRKVLGMWITQQMGEQVSVLMVHGAAPDDICRQYRMAQPPRYASIARSRFQPRAPAAAPRHGAGNVAG